jgi:membrane protein implicated in regulation of membrane protease activity
MTVFRTSSRKSGRPSRRAAVKYALLNLPEVLAGLMVLMFVQKWLELPHWAVWLLGALWILKEALIFPFVWRSYDSGSERNTYQMVGMRGIVEKRLAPSGYIRIRGELWQAETGEKDSPVEVGEKVIVRGRRGLLLLVERNRDQMKNSAI